MPQAVMLGFSLQNLFYISAKALFMVTEIKFLNYNLFNHG